MFKSNVVKYAEYMQKSTFDEYKIYTLDIINKYNAKYKSISKYKNKIEVKFILYNNVYDWYTKEKNLNIGMEKAYIRTKLGSYTSGGCGIAASLFAGLTASGIISYLDYYIKKLGPLFLAIYTALIISFGFATLSKEDKKVEMYNIFLEALYKLEKDKNEKLG